MLTLDNVYRASYVLKDVVRKTDVIYAPKLCPGTELYLKTENLQVTGSFKVRGAYYKTMLRTAIFPKMPKKRSNLLSAVLRTIIRTYSLWIMPTGFCLNPMVL